MKDIIINERYNYAKREIAYKKQNLEHNCV